MTSEELTAALQSAEISKWLHLIATQEWTNYDRLAPGFAGDLAKAILVEVESQRTAPVVDATST